MIAKSPDPHDEKQDAAGDLQHEPIADDEIADRLNPEGDRGGKGGIAENRTRSGGEEVRLWKSRRFEKMLMEVNDGRDVNW